VHCATPPGNGSIEIVQPLNGVPVDTSWNFWQQVSDTEPLPVLVNVNESSIEVTRMSVMMIVLFMLLLLFGFRFIGLGFKVEHIKLLFCLKQNLIMAAYRLLSELRLRKKTKINFPEGI
jgi:hypothetical protein